MKVLLFCLLLLTTTAEAQVSRIDLTSQLCYSNRCAIETSSASCFCVGRYGSASLYVSAGHIFGSKPTDQGVQVQIKRACVNVDGRGYVAKLLGWQYTQRFDVSLWAVRTPPSTFRSIPLAKLPPQIGDRVKVLGYGSSTTLIKSEARVSRTTQGLVYVDTNFALGDSGGPLIGSQSVAIGVISGFSNVQRNTGFGTRADMVRKWIKMHWSTAMLTEPPRRAEPPSQESGGIDLELPQDLPQTLPDSLPADPPKPLPPQAELGGLLAQLQEINKRLDTLESRPVPKDQTKNIDILAATVLKINNRQDDLEKSLTAAKRPTVVQWYNSDGFVKEESYPYGEPIRLYFNPPKKE